jgi:hypothetical protein
MDMIKRLDKDAIHWNTPKQVWELINDYLPKDENSVIWEPFYNSESRSADHLRSLGCKVVSGNVNFFKTKVSLGTHIVSNPPFDCKEKVIEHLAYLDVPFILTFPIHSLATRFIKNHFKNKLQLIIPDTRLHFEKKDRDTGKTIVLKRTPFDTIFFCYKINLPRDLIWL